MAELNFTFLWLGFLLMTIYQNPTSLLDDVLSSIALQQDYLTAHALE
jgi:hypothetical protein